MLFCFFACGGENTAQNYAEVGGSSSGLNLSLTNCDKLVSDYDKLVETYIKLADESLETGKEIDQKEIDKISKEAKELSERAQKLGMDGIGGQACWQEFAAIQQKWGKAAMKLQTKAMEKAQEMMKQYQDQNNQ